MECGIERAELLILHGANSFIHIFQIFRQVVKDELAVLQQRNTVGLPTETRITFTLC